MNTYEFDVVLKNMAEVSDDQAEALFWPVGYPLAVAQVQEAGLGVSKVVERRRSGVFENVRGIGERPSMNISPLHNHPLHALNP